jgi:hypothetical protein
MLHLSALIHGISDVMLVEIPKANLFTFYIYFLSFILISFRPYSFIIHFICPFYRHSSHIPSSSLYFKETNANTAPNLPLH